MATFIIEEERWGKTLKECIGDEQLISVPEGVKWIASNAFEKCKNVEKIIIPDGATVIMSYAFAGCKKLKEITIPKTIVGIDETDVEGVREIYFPGTIEELEEKLESWCIAATFHCTDGDCGV